MNHSSALWGSAFAAALECTSIAGAWAQVTFGNLSGLAYPQNFNALAASRTGDNTPINRWNDNDPLPHSFKAH
jgi:hypothetical protein